VTAVLLLLLLLLLNDVQFVHGPLWPDGGPAWGQNCLLPHNNHFIKVCWL